MALTPNNMLAANFAFTLTLPFSVANTTDWLTLCAGPTPDDETLRSITGLTDQLVQDAKVGMIASNAGATWGYHSPTAVPPLYQMGNLPTVSTFEATATGEITWALVRIAGGKVIVVSAGATNSGAVIQVDNPIITEVGQSVHLEAIKLKLWS